MGHYFISFSLFYDALAENEAELKPFLELKL
jgi:hypothetical protein